jgi:hypothetical protein
MLAAFVAVVLLAQRGVSSNFEGIPPIANAGFSRYAGPDPIVLDGTASYDPDNSGTLSYKWQQISGPSVVISDSNTATPTISGFVQTDEIQLCEFELVVSDDELKSQPDIVKIIIVREFGNSKLIHLNPPFDPDKPTWIRFGGLGGCGNIGSKPSWFANWPEDWGGWGILDEKVNCIWFEQIQPYDFEAGKKIGDMLIVYLSSHAPDYKQPIQSDGHSAGGQPAIDIGIYLNETYADARYAVNRVTLLDAAGYCRDYSISIDRFLASAVDGEQCWIDSYPATLPGSYGQKMDYGFQANVLTVWFDEATGPHGTQFKHELPLNFYGNSLIDKNLQRFNHGVVAGAYWSVIGPGKNLQLASTPGVETYKFTWYGSAFSGYMDFYDEHNHPGRLPEPVTLFIWGDALDPNGIVLTCKESENAVGYELLFGPNPYRVMDYDIISDTSTPPSDVITTLPFDETWWTVRVRDQYGSTIYADPKRIDSPILSLPIENTKSERRYSCILDAIGDASPGDEIAVKEGIYHESIDFQGKSLMVTSINPNDPNVVAATIINGVGQLPVVTLSGGQGAACVLAGLTITGETVGISCSDSSPTIRNCTIENTPISIEFLSGYEPIINDCTILGSVMEIYDPNQVAHWKLDETEGAIAYDSNGDKDAILFNGPVWRPDEGKRNGALELDGINDYASTPFILDPSYGPFSIFAWIKGGELGQVIISQTDGSGTGETWLGADSLHGTLMTSLSSPAGRIAQPPLVSEFLITDGEWHHVGFVWDSSCRFLYADGAEVARDAVAQNPLKSATGSLYFGADKNLSPASFFSGLIDDVRIYDVALTAEEIAALAR